MRGSTGDSCVSRCGSDHRSLAFLSHSASIREWLTLGTKALPSSATFANASTRFFVDEGIDLSVKRNLDQYQAKDLCDIELPGFAIECKAYKSGWWHLSAWWDQVCEACGDKTPILVWKFNNKPIRVTLPLHAIKSALAG